MKVMLIFLARLETAISHTVIGEETKKQLEKLLAYENATHECKKAITPIRETGSSMPAQAKPEGGCDGKGWPDNKLFMHMDALPASSVYRQNNL